jgi:hypothetical protein
LIREINDSPLRLQFKSIVSNLRIILYNLKKNKIIDFQNEMNKLSLLYSNYHDRIIKSFIPDESDLDDQRFLENILKFETIILCKEENYFQIKDILDFDDNILRYHSFENILDVIKSNHSGKLSGELLMKYLIKTKEE